MFPERPERSGMMHKRTFVVSVFILVSALSVLAQGTVEPNVVQQVSEEIVANNKRLAGLLHHPSFVKLRLLSIPRDVPREKPTDTPGPYKVRDRIEFLLLITQNLPDKLSLENLMVPNYEYRPELIRDGYIVPYTKRAKEATEKYERAPPDGSMYLVTLDSGKEQGWAGVNLEDWYEPLDPGHY